MKKKKNKIKYFIVAIAIFFAGFLIEKIFEARIIVNDSIIKYDGILSLADIMISVFSLASIYLLVVQLKSEHEKARREKACELMLVWTKELKRETNIAKKVVEKFSKEQCRCLYLEEIFKVKCSLYADIVEATNTKAESAVKSERARVRNIQVATEKEKTGSEDKAEDTVEMKEVKEKTCALSECRNNGDCDAEVELTKEQVKKLRHSIISYLNLVESILVAWQYSIADREIIEDQFSFLVSPKEGHNVLEDFRIACGSEETYPAIEIFCTHLENKLRDKLKEKGNIV